MSCQTNHWVVLPLAGLSLLVFLYQKQKVFPLAKSLCILHLNLWVFLYIVRYIHSRRVVSCQTNLWVFPPLAGLTQVHPFHSRHCSNKQTKGKKSINTPNLFILFLTHCNLVSNIQVFESKNASKLIPTLI